MNKAAPPSSESPVKTSPIRVAVVEDDENARELFRRTVVKSPGVCCIGAFATGEAALNELPSLLPDLVLMDIHLPGMSGIECMQQLRQSLPSLKVVVVTCERADEFLFAALRAGADSYLTKPCDRKTLVRVIAETMAGRHPIASDMTAHLMQAAIAPPKARPCLVAHPNLSDRENEVMRWVAKGMENKEIAKRLKVSVFTVNAHLHSAYTKLEARNRVEAIGILAQGGSLPQKTG